MGFTRNEVTREAYDAHCVRTHAWHVRGYTHLPCQIYLWSCVIAASYDTQLLPLGFSDVIS